MGAAKQRALLAVLLLHAGETMPTERLVDALWGEQPPATAVKALQVYVSQLRKTLGDGVHRDAPARLRRAGRGRRARPAALRAAARARAGGCSTRARRGEAGEVLREALALWRGEPLADFRYEAFAAQRDRPPGGAAPDRAGAAARGRPGRSAATPRRCRELEALVREHPLRESLRGLLMLALYRSGRQADALAVMQDARATLARRARPRPEPARCSSSRRRSCSRTRRSTCRRRGARRRRRAVEPAQSRPRAPLGSTWPRARSARS